MTSLPPLITMATTIPLTSNSTSNPLTDSSTDFSSSLKVLSHFKLPRASDNCQPLRAFLLPGGDWLVAMADLNPIYRKKGPECIWISLWDLRDLSNPRCVIESRIQGVAQTAAADESNEEVSRWEEDDVVQCVP